MLVLGLGVRVRVREVIVRVRSQAGYETPVYEKDMVRDDWK